MYLVLRQLYTNFVSSKVIKGRDNFKLHHLICQDVVEMAR